MLNHVRGISLVIATWTCLSTVGANAAKNDIETVIVTGERPSADICAKIAAAKLAQWAQPRITVQTTRNFADGAQKVIETIFTANTVYGQQDHRGWNSIQIVQRQRSAGTPELVEKRMALTQCYKEAATQEAGQDATAYKFLYAPDADGWQDSGEIWIADSSGLPLRQELHVANPNVANLATQVTVRYSYGDDVHVPLEAERADNMRRERVQQWLIDLQLGRPGWGP